MNSKAVRMPYLGDCYRQLDGCKTKLTDMSKLSYTAKIRLSITMDEIHRYSKPLVNNNELKEAIKDELMQCAEGIVGGDFGGNYRDDWKLVFFRQLEKQGVIELNEYGKDTF